MIATLVLAAMAATGTGIGDGTGKVVYTQYCASCHGVDLRGGPNAPSLRNVGAADADFWVSTGRMPGAVPWVQVGHRGAQPYLTPLEQNAVVRYVAFVSPGPPIPAVVANGDAAHGRRLFAQNCMHCHGADAGGASIGRVDWAPSLSRATVTQVAEAIRIGPGQMPLFGERQLDQNDVDDIATYLSAGRTDARFAGLPTRAGGAVPEGLYGWLAAAALALFAYAFWSRDRKGADAS